MTLVRTGAVLILAAGTVAWLFRRSFKASDRAYRILMLAGAGLVAADALPVVAGWSTDPNRPDLLSAWFLLAIVTVGAVTGAYGVSYLDHERSHRGIAGAHAQFSVLLVALIGVVTATSVVMFLAAWEVMAVSGYFLVIFDYDRPEVRRAGFVYLVLTHTSTLALIGAFAAWSNAAADIGFDGLRDAAPQLGDRLPWVLGLALLGFGIKAGIVPLHFWLPGAHAAAPSHVSALLSGVVIKTGIYGLLRTIQLLGAVPAWWGWLVLLLGVVSGVLGVLWALAQHDLKRLLAYHSVENIGIILMGVGTGALGMAYHQPLVATLGFAGALLHTLNHALFKSLLFLGAGAVVQVTGTRMIDQLGGLARRMPGTAAAFLLGSVAISGLPPLNGFVSEWLVLRGLMETGRSTEVVRFAVAALPGLALIGGLAVACFTKLNAVMFLGIPRDDQPIAESRVRSGMLGPIWGLAGACALLGIVPLLGVVPAADVAAFTTGTSAGSEAVYAGSAALSAVAVALALVAGLVWAVRRAGGPTPVRWTGTWACAGAPPTARMQYTAASYAMPLLAAMAPLAGLRVSRTDVSIHSHPVDLVLDGVMLPVWARVRRLSQHARLLQAGIRRYLLYLVLTLLFLLFYLGFQQ